MGFSTLIDILGSVVIGGMLLLILLRINDIAVRKSFTFTGDAILQKNLVEIVKLLEYDFRRMGYNSDWANIDPTVSAILLADSTAISFTIDGSPVSYSVGDPSELLGTPNPNDILLYRSENGNPPLASNLGVTRFELSYYDLWGNEIATPVVNFGTIETIQIDLVVEDVYGYEDRYGEEETYTKSAWRQIRMSSRNRNGR